MKSGTSWFDSRFEVVDDETLADRGGITARDKQADDNKLFVFMSVATATGSESAMRPQRWQVSGDVRETLEALFSMNQFPSPDVCKGAPPLCMALVVQFQVMLLRISAPFCREWAHFFIANL